MELYLALNLGSNREVPHVLDYPTQSEGISLSGDSADSSELYLTLEPSGDFAKTIKLLMKSRSIQRGKKSKGIHINSEIEFESEINTHNSNNISNIIK